MNAPSQDDPEASSGAADAASLTHAVDSFAARVRAASASFKHGAAEQAARLKQEAKDHPLETVTGAFGLGYLVGKALFKRRPK
jgi:hypothetical protein